MSFLAPLMLLGLLGVAVPIAVHLIGRRRAPVLPFSAIDFLIGENRRVARRLRLREILLFAARVAACLAIPLALAKPFVSCTAAGPTVQRGPQAVALVIDNSLTMQAQLGGRTMLATAKERAAAVLEALGPDADVALVPAAEGEDVPGQLERDLPRSRTSLAQLAPSLRPPDLAHALLRAAALLSASPHAARRVYLFTALTRSAFPPGATPIRLDPALELHVVDVADGQPLANLALVGLTAEREAGIGAGELRVEVAVANLGPSPVVDRVVTLRLGGRAVAKGLVSVAAGGTVTKPFSVALPADAALADLVAELPPDALTADDRRYLRLDRGRDLRVLLVDGDPSTVKRSDEAFYLETALRPGGQGTSGMVVTTIPGDALGDRHLDDFDVVFLLNAKAPGAAEAAALEAWTKKGGGLFVAVGDNVDPEAYNAQLGGILPQELGTARVARGAAGGEPGGDRIGRLDAAHPIFTVFSAQAAGLREARFAKFLLLGPSVRGDEKRTLASYASGAPALVEARLGAGRVLLYTSTLDRDWNDVPIHPGFLPFVQQAARYLGRASGREGARPLIVGEARSLAVTPADRRLEVVAPAGAKTAFGPERLAGRSSVSFTGTSEPGFYTVAAGGANGTPRRRTEADFVVNLDPRGSDVRPAQKEDVPVGDARGGIEAAAAPMRRVELWHGIAAALLVFLLGEAALVARG